MRYTLQMTLLTCTCIKNEKKNLYLKFIAQIKLTAKIWPTQKRSNKYDIFCARKQLCKNIQVDLIITKRSSSWLQATKFVHVPIKQHFVALSPFLFPSIFCCFIEPQTPFVFFKIWFDLYSRGKCTSRKHTLQTIAIGFLIEKEMEDGGLIIYEMWHRK